MPDERSNYEKGMALLGGAVALTVLYYFVLGR